MPVEKVIGLVSSVHDVYMVVKLSYKRWAMHSMLSQLKKEKKKKKIKTGLWLGWTQKSDWLNCDPSFSIANVYGCMDCADV